MPIFEGTGYRYDSPLHYGHALGLVECESREVAQEFFKQKLNAYIDRYQPWLRSTSYIRSFCFALVTQTYIEAIP